MEHRLRDEISKEYDLPELHALVNREEWVKKAACRGLNPDIFFPVKGDNVSVKEAKQICEPCEVKEECLDYGLRIDDCRRGIYGGMTGIERRVYKRTLYINGQNRKSA